MWVCDPLQNYEIPWKMVKPPITWILRVVDLEYLEWILVTKIVKRLPERWVVLDFGLCKGLSFSSKNCFIYWSPNDSTPREKMMTMSTKSKFKEKLGCEIEIQIFDNSDLEIENIGRVTHADWFYAFHW